MWCYALGVVAVVLRSWCVVLCTVCQLVFLTYIYDARSHLHQVSLSVQEFSKFAVHPITCYEGAER